LEGTKVSVLLFLLPTAVGAALAVACIALRRRLPRWLPIEWLASFVAAFGLGTGIAATALDARGLRLPMLEWFYGAKERHFREALQRKTEETSPR
jgi:hypothetical protein